MNMSPILFADDDKDDHLLIQLALQQLSIFNPLITVTNGKAVLDYLNNHSPYQDKEKYPTPAVILLDLHMPIKSGLEVLQVIKSDKVMQHIPVIVFTNHAEEHLVHKSKNQGAELFVVKPFHFEELVVIMKGIYERWLSK